MPGAVVGNITPYSIALNVVTDIALTATNTTDSYHTYVGPGGGFIFERVPPGNYILRIKTNSAYYPPPPDISVTVKAEDTTFAGIITISYSAAVQTGTLLFSVNGGPDHILNGGDLEAGGMSYGFIRLFGIESGGTQSGYYKFELHVSGVAEPGNYSVQNASYLEVWHYTSGSLDGYWKAGNGYSNATVNISSFDTTTKKFSGTFNGTLSPISHSVDSIQISGSFTDVYGG